MNLGTIIDTWLNGEQVGTDEFGNRYYKAKNKKDTLHGRQRRWVIYKNDREPSTVPPEWHAWLHFTSEEPLTEQAAQAKAWQKPHQENPTGSPEAYRPGGHDLKGGVRAGATGDYQAWKPE